MEDEIQEPQKIDSLDLEKYGLFHLKGRNILDLDSSDMDKLLNALGNDDISINVPVPFNPQNIKELLSQSECRKCGKCCIPNPLNPRGPGIEVFDDELKLIAHHLNSSYETLKEGTLEGKNMDYPYPLDEIIGTRWLPLPCPFYIEEAKECQVYRVRPFVCAIYPVVSADNDSNIDIKVNCDYGKDLAVSALRNLRMNNSNLVLRI
ncbi:YkgJ family cysteine cluster protein [Chloroflexota bacterium]